MKKRIEIGSLDAGLYKLHIPNSTSITSLCNSISHLVKNHSCNQTTTSLWHARLGHPPLSVLQQLPITMDGSLSDPCDIYHYAKQTWMSFPLSQSGSSSKFSLIHCDVWSPYKHYTHGKFNHFLTIVNDYSRCTWVFLFMTNHRFIFFLKTSLPWFKLNSTA